MVSKDFQREIKGFLRVSTNNSFFLHFFSQELKTCVFLASKHNLVLQFLQKRADSARVQLMGFGNRQSGHGFLGIGFSKRLKWLSRPSYRWGSSHKKFCRNLPPKATTFSKLQFWSQKSPKQNRTEDLQDPGEEPAARLAAQGIDGFLACLVLGERRGARSEEVSIPGITLGLQRVSCAFWRSLRPPKNKQAFVVVVSYGLFKRCRFQFFSFSICLLTKSGAF